MSSNPPRSREGYSLPIGFVERRARRRAVRFRVQEGDVQRRLLDADLAGAPERAASAALAVYVERLGENTEPTPSMFHALTFADRHALIARLCVLEGRPEISIVTDCSRCKTRLELSLDLRTVSPRSHDPRRPIRLRFRAAERAMRLPTAEDAEHASDDIDLVAACLNCRRDEGELWLERAEGAMSMFDPLGRIEVSGACLSCTGPVRAAGSLVDSWLWRVARRAAELIDEVHALAVHYHWPERDIIALPPARRAAYLELCDAL